MSDGLPLAERGTPLAECEPLAPLLAAFARGTKRSRLRLLAVVCPAGHTLIEVFPTAGAKYAVWKRRGLHDRDEWLAGPLWAELFDEHLGVADAYYYPEGTASCRCTETARVDGRQLAAWLSENKRRVVLTP